MEAASVSARFRPQQGARLTGLSEAISGPDRVPHHETGGSGLGDRPRRRVVTAR